MIHCKNLIVRAHQRRYLSNKKHIGVNKRDTWAHLFYAWVANKGPKSRRQGQVPIASFFRLIFDEHFNSLVGWSSTTVVIQKVQPNVILLSQHTSSKATIVLD